jgi:hypothetical protein
VACHLEHTSAQLLTHTHRCGNPPRSVTQTLNAGGARKASGSMSPNPNAGGADDSIISIATDAGTAHEADAAPAVASGVVGSADAEAKADA